MILNNYRNDTYTQFGEDGIIQQLLPKLGLSQTNGTCVEFGAWDGIQFSNTRRLIEQGWSGLLIECDKDKFCELEMNYPYDRFPNVVLANIKVEISGHNSIDDILYEALFPSVDFMVIDVDGDDYHIWKNMTVCKPKVVMVECNATFPINVEFVQRSSYSIGSSALSLYLLGKEKGYTLVCFNRINLFFVRNDLLYMLDEIIPFYKLYIVGASEEIYLSKDYDGKLYQYGLWDLHESKLHSIQALTSMAERFEIWTGEKILTL